MSNEKLELKHLAPYLPYGLKLQSKNPFGIKHTCSLVFEREEYLECNIKTAIKYQFKPILIPLSELTKESAINYGYPDEHHLERSVLSSHAPYKIWIELVSEHYDVFGLIDKGLAIDINKLEDETNG
jgi:hypothetical protein